MPALYPLLTEGFPKTHDASVHLIRLHLLDEQIRAGNLFPRWLPDLMTGYGYPTFNFYAPMIYIIAEVLHLDGAPLAYSLTIMMGMLVVLAGWGMYFLASNLYKSNNEQARWAGVAAGVAYIYTPYLLVNLYVRGALAELLAQALLPWLFWCVARIFTTSIPTRYIVGAAAPGVYTLKTGMYDPASGERVPLVDGDGASMIDQFVPIGEFTISQPLR